MQRRWGWACAPLKNQLRNRWLFQLERSKFIADLIAFCQFAQKSRSKVKSDTELLSQEKTTCWNLSVQPSAMRGEQVTWEFLMQENSPSFSMSLSSSTSLWYPLWPDDQQLEAMLWFQPPRQCSYCPGFLLGGLPHPWYATALLARGQTAAGSAIWKLSRFLGC